MQHFRLFMDRDDCDDVTPINSILKEKHPCTNENKKGKRRLILVGTQCQN